jgi:hypothetical protein
LCLCCVCVVFVFVFLYVCDVVMFSCRACQASKELVDLLYDRTEGIPFYVLEFAFAMESKEFVHFCEQTWSLEAPPPPYYTTNNSTNATTTTTNNNNNNHNHNTTTIAPQTTTALTMLKVADLRLHVDAMQLPNGIKGVIVAHFDALESQVQDVLIVASVLGR